MKSLLGGITLLFACSVGWAQGGPPLLTDDPETPGNGHWEINLAAQTRSQSPRTTFEAPYIDLNYGYGDRIQLKFETAFLYTDYSDSGLGSSMFGVKWRYFDRDNWAASLYPQYEFHGFYSSKEPDLLEPGTKFVLPFQFQYRFKNWTVNAEAGYQHFSRQPDQLLFGSIVSWSQNKTLELMLETRWTAQYDYSGTEAILNAGFRLAVSERVALLFSIGKTFLNFKNENSAVISFAGAKIDL
jgi:hypothetical protein